jgi:hypothetical protein
MIATARVQPAEALSIFTGKQDRPWKIVGTLVSNGDQATDSKTF